MQFVDWNPASTRVSQISHIFEQSYFGKTNLNCVMMKNTTAVTNVINNMNVCFDKLYYKRSHVHWLVCDGMDTGELTEAREDTAVLNTTYDEI